MWSAGAAWILVPALARAYWGVNEIITTLLLNFVAVQLVVWASLGFWRDEASAVIQSTERVPVRSPAMPGTESLTIGVAVPAGPRRRARLVFRSRSRVRDRHDRRATRARRAFAGIDVRGGSSW